MLGLRVFAATLVFFLTLSSVAAQEPAPTSAPETEDVPQVPSAVADQLWRDRSLRPQAASPLPVVHRLEFHKTFFATSARVATTSFTNASSRPSAMIRNTGSVPE